MVAKSVPNIQIKKKRVLKFNRFQSDRFNRLKKSWRKPRGIDCRVRRRFKGTNIMPSIGFGSDKRTRYRISSGHYKITISNINELNMLLTQNDKYAVEISRKVSSRKRIDLVNRAQQLGVFVVNNGGRSRFEENE